MLDLRLVEVVEQRQRQVRRRAVAAGPTVQRLGPRLRHQLAEVLDRAGRGHHHHHRAAGQQCHRPQVFLEAETRLRKQRRVGRMRQRDGQQRVAVTGRLGDDVGTDLAAAAGLVVDDDVELPALAQLLADLARHHVGQAAGRKGHDVADGRCRLRIVRALRPQGLRCDQWRRGHQADHAAAAQQFTSFHHGLVSCRCGRVRFSPRPIAAAGCRPPPGLRFRPGGANARGARRAGADHHRATSRPPALRRGRGSLHCRPARPGR